MKREVINILNSKETTLESLQVKIDELQATNEYWKTQAKELHKEVLELTVLQQKQEKRKAAAIALKVIKCICFCFICCLMFFFMFLILKTWSEHFLSL